MNGDGRVDLVVTAGSIDSVGLLQFGATSDPYWRVYLNDGTGFSLEPTQWSTPMGGAVGITSSLGFNRTRSDAFGPSASREGSQRWCLKDMDADARPDLVVMSTYMPSLNYPVQFEQNGEHFWRVHLNNGAGFDPTPINWLTPDGGMVIGDGQVLGFPAFQNDQVGVGNGTTIGNDLWRVVDMTGDSRPDLVMTSERVEDVNWMVYEQFSHEGSPVWLVHINNGAGFDEEPLFWPTPEGGLVDPTTGFGFTATFGGSDHLGSQTWAMEDMQGDGRPDLVVFAAVENNGITAQFGHGVSPHWKVHLNTGVDFAAPALDWPTPMGGFQNDLDLGYTFSEQIFNSSSEEIWSMLDLGGDGAPELVVFGSGDEAAIGPGQFMANGMPVWYVYDNMLAGFSSEAVLCATPSGGMVDSDGDMLGFLGSQNESALVLPDNEAWSILDLNGDMHLDLVVTSLGGVQFGSEEDPHWRVFLGSDHVQVEDLAMSEFDHRIHPNPCDADCWLVREPSGDKTSFIIRDLVGREVMVGSTRGSTLLQLGALRPGVYFVVPESRAGCVLRFIVE